MTFTDKQKRVAKWVAIIGTILGALCPVLPTEYQQVCSAISTACSGGML